MIDKIKERIKKYEELIETKRKAKKYSINPYLKQFLGIEINQHKNAIKDLELMLELAEKLECYQN